MADRTNMVEFGERKMPSGGLSDPRDIEFSNDFLAHLVAEGVLDTHAKDRAISAQHQTGQRIDIVLTELGLISTQALLEVSAQYLRLPLCTAAEMPVEPILPDLLPYKFLHRNQLVPLKSTDSGLTVAVSDPFASTTIRSIEFLVEKPVSVHLASKSFIEDALARMYAGDLDERTGASTFKSVDINEDDVQRLKDIASEAPVIRFVGRTISTAVTRRASDIHVEPMVDHVRIRFRIDGTMHEIERLPLTMQAAVATRIKILATLNIAERRLPQDGRSKYVVDGREIDLRVSTTPTMHGESIVLRILDQSQVDLSFPALGFDKATIELLRGLLARSNGIVMVTGPTGSGKTTTLYAALRKLNVIDRKLFTVEDPIEYQLSGVNQMQVKPSIGLDFVQALRSILRQDPDVIMIGEMRDVETARIAMQASLTGHLVLSTLHTNSAAASVTRLLDMGVENFLLASTLSGIVAQRLVRRLCDSCARPCALADQQIRELQEVIGQHSRDLAIATRTPVGCVDCHKTGFLGRTTISETMVFDDTIRDAVLTGASSRELERLSKERGMKTLYQSGVLKVLTGETTIAEVVKATTA